MKAERRMVCLQAKRHQRWPADPGGQERAVERLSLTALRRSQRRSPASRTARSKFLLYKPLCLWHSVAATPKRRTTVSIPCTLRNKVWSRKCDVFRNLVVCHSHNRGAICLGEAPEGDTRYRYFTEKRTQGSVTSKALFRY